jgi:hypothetical protein
LEGSIVESQEIKAKPLRLRPQGQNNCSKSFNSFAPNCFAFQDGLNSYVFPIDDFYDST